MSLRVLQIVTTMEMGGIENYLMSLYRHIDKEKIQFDFLKHRSERHYYDDEIRSLGGNIYCAPPIDPRTAKKYNEWLTSFFKAHNYKIVHSHLNSESAYPLRIAAKCGVPVRIAHAHSTKVTLDYKMPFRLYDKYVLENYYTNALACTNEAGKFLFKKNFTIVPNAINSELFRYNKNAVDALISEFELNDKFVVGMVANYKPVKNFEFALEVFKRVVDKKSNAVFLLVGNGIKENLAEMIENMGISNKVIFAGGRSDIETILHCMDVFILPSKYEGFSISVLEAETVGLPVIASTGIPQTVKLHNAMNTEFLPTKNPNLWANKILSLCGIKKMNMVDYIKTTSYDVGKSSVEITDFYENMVRRYEKIENSGGI